MAKALVCPYCNSINSELDKNCKKCGNYLLSIADKQIISKLQEEIQKLKADSIPNKWEYLEVSSDQIESYGGLQSLGRQGWELVAATSYSEGGGLTISGVGSESYTIKLMYIFKRPSLPSTEKTLNALKDIASRTPKHLLEYLRQIEGF